MSEKRIEVEKTGDGYLVRLNNDNDKVNGWHSIFYQLPDRFTIIIPDPQGKQDEPMSREQRLRDLIANGYESNEHLLAMVIVELIGLVEGRHDERDERIAALEGKANKPQEVILRLPEVLVRDNTTGALMFFTEQANEPPAPAEPTVDLDALLEKVKTAGYRCGLFRELDRIFKEASRENL
jgi:hypothetical protein